MTPPLSVQPSNPTSIGWAQVCTHGTEEHRPGKGALGDRAALVPEAAVAVPTYHQRRQEPTGTRAGGTEAAALAQAHHSQTLCPVLKLPWDNSYRWSSWWICAATLQRQVWGTTAETPPWPHLPGVHTPASRSPGSPLKKERCANNRSIEPPPLRKENKHPDHRKLENVSLHFIQTG